MSAHIDAAMHRLLTLIREFDIASGWHVQGALSCAGLRGSEEPLDLAMMADGEVIATATARRLCCDAGELVA